MEDNDLVMFDAPIPGSSLTTELGSEPHERPAEIADPADAYQFIADNIATEDAFERIAVAAEIGVPVELIARSIVFAAWANGKIGFDSMYLIYGPIFELMMKMLDNSQIEYIPLAKRKEDTRLKEAMNLLKEQEAKIKELTGETEEPEEVEEEEPSEDEEDKPSIPRGGLMGGE
jgi:hypothetical protein|tara:strand:+ start:184 stop:705 length:522 start_codon:yes stop_codon:yes gene_type:complete